MKRYLLILPLYGLFCTTAFSQLQNTGWKSPSATHAPNGWTNPQNAYASDDVYATVAHQSGCRCPFMDLSWDDGISYTPYKLFGIFGTSDIFIAEGDSTDDWGHVWTATDTERFSFCTSHLESKYHHQAGICRVSIRNSCRQSR